MELSRRQFVHLLAVAGAAGLMLPGAHHRSCAVPDGPEAFDLPLFGNARLLHFTDCHGQLLPIYFREPNVNLGVGAARGRPPHLVGEALLQHFEVILTMACQRPASSKTKAALHL